MSPSAERILKEALGLSENERADVAASLLESLSPPVDEMTEAEWKSTLQRRWDELESGKVQAIPWEVVDADLRRMLDESADA